MAKTALNSSSCFLVMTFSGPGIPGPGWNAGYGAYGAMPGAGPAPGGGGGGDAVSDVFGLIVPGRPVVTEFQCVLGNVSSRI